MRWSHLLMLGLSIFLATACSRPANDEKPATSDSSPPLSDSRDEEGPLVSDPGLFSYQAPWGWKSLVSSNGYPQAAGPEANQFVPDITFTTHGYQELFEFVKTYQPILLDTDTPFPMKMVDQKPFDTDTGVRGVRLHSIDVANPPTAEQFSYVFRGPKGLLFEFACACAPAETAHDLPLFDTAMKTMIFLPSGN